MSTLKVDTITDEEGTGAPNFSNGVALSGTPLSGVASEAEAEAGTDNAHVMTPLRVEQHMQANDLGVNQTWQNLFSSRSANTTFQNTTGRPIVVSCSTSALISALRVSSNNVTFIDAATRGNSSKEAIVPPGHFYRLFNDNNNVGHWAELR